MPPLGWEFIKKKEEDKPKVFSQVSGYGMKLMDYDLLSNASWILSFFTGWSMSPGELKDELGEIFCLAGGLEGRCAFIRSIRLLSSWNTQSTFSAEHWNDKGRHIIQYNHASKQLINRSIDRSNERPNVEPTDLLSERITQIWGILLSKKMSCLTEIRKTFRAFSSVVSKAEKETFLSDNRVTIISFHRLVLMMIRRVPAIRITAIDKRGYRFP